MGNAAAGAPTIEEIQDRDVPAVVDLWSRCGLLRPSNDPVDDIALARASPNAAVLAARAEGRLVGAVMVGHDGHRGALYYLAVDPNVRRQRLGAALVGAATLWLGARGVPKLNLMVRPENEAVGAFYRALGFDREERHVYALRLDRD